MSYLTRMKWDADKGEPAKDKLSARLRAKYYGAKVVTYRPFVLGILECSADVTADDIGQQVFQYARAGINALINSTRAFYGLGDPESERPIVTNVWGTAHA